MFPTLRFYHRLHAVEEGPRIQSEGTAPIDKRFTADWPLFHGEF